MKQAVGRVENPYMGKSPEELQQLQLGVVNKIRGMTGLKPLEQLPDEQSMANGQRPITPDIAAQARAAMAPGVSMGGGSHNHTPAISVSALERSR